MKQTRVEINLADLSLPLKINGNTGIFLRYEPIYDQIRNARHEEDDGLSRGIWQTDLKHADWSLAENLCYNTILKDSKDFQIACWLVEAWLHLDNFTGLINGYQFLLEFCEKFWDNMHPQPEDGDIEYRLHILEWLIKVTYDNIITFPISNLDNAVLDRPLTLSDWNFALNLEKISRRGSDGTKAAQDLVKKGSITLDKFRSFMLSIPYDFIHKKKEQTLEAKAVISKFSDFIDTKLTNYTLSFSSVINQIDSILKMCDNTIGKLEEPQANLTAQIQDEFIEGNIEENIEEKRVETSNDNVTVADRQTAYRALREIGEFLQNLDPHSPAPHLLNLLVSWENKTLLQILADMGKEPPETLAMIQMLASSNRIKE